LYLLVVRLKPHRAAYDTLVAARLFALLADLPG
jgi:hypothetical protein